MPEQNKLPGAGELFSQSYNYFLEHWKILMGISVVPVILGLPYVLFESSLGLGLSGLGAVFARLGIFIVVAGGGAAGVVDAYKKGLKFFFPLIWIGIISAVAIIGGFVLLIIPGIIVSILLCVSYYPLFTEGRRGMSALTLSWAYVKGYSWKVLWRLIFVAIASWIILFILIMLFSLFIPDTSPVNSNEPTRAEQTVNIIFGNLIFLPFATIYGFLLYQALKNAKAGSPAGESLEAEEEGAKKKLKILATLGILGIIALAALAFYFIGIVGPLLDSNWQYQSSLSIFPGLDLINLR